MCRGRAGWYFPQCSPNQKLRNPITKESFKSENLSNSLVRETIQNSLDARRPDAKGPVTVVFRICRGPTPAAERSLRLFDDLWPHIRACQWDTRESFACPNPYAPSHYLVIEDYNTTGLTGDVRASHENRNQQKANHFYHFFRGEGVTDKLKDARGSWGVGKVVFLMCSKLNTVFGVTKRYDDGKVYLMGMCTLESHQIDGITYTPDGLYGIVPEKPEQQLILPISDSFQSPEERAILHNFCRSFRIGRDTPGLSLVIPYVEIEESNYSNEDPLLISFQKLQKAVVEEYFWPILQGDLEVIITEEHFYEIERTVKVDKDAMLKNQIPLPDQIRAFIDIWQKKSRADHVPLELSLDQVTKRSLDSNLSARIRNDLEAGHTLAFRFTLDIRTKGAAAGQRTFFFLYCKQINSRDRYFPYFIRNGIWIKDAWSRLRTNYPPGIITLVEFEDPIICEFLSKAEGPAHKGWDASNVKHTYVNANNLLKQILNSPVNLLSVIEESSSERDYYILVDDFPADNLDEKLPVKNEAVRAASKTEMVAPGTSNLVIIAKSKDGFTLELAKNQPTDLTNKSVLVQVAYACYDRSKSFKMHSVHDFDFRKLQCDSSTDGYIQRFSDKEGICCEITCGHLEDRGPYHLVITPIQYELFKVSLRGFDPHRDLYVEAGLVANNQKEGENAGTPLLQLHRP